MHKFQEFMLLIILLTVKMHLTSCPKIHIPFQFIVIRPRLFFLLVYKNYFENGPSGGRKKKQKTHHWKKKLILITSEHRQHIFYNLNTETKNQIMQ